MVDMVALFCFSGTAQQSAHKRKVKTMAEMAHQKNAPLIIRRADLKKTVGLSPSTIDRLESAGKFPRRRRYGMAITGWLYSEIENWIETAGTPIEIGGDSDD